VVLPKLVLLVVVFWSMQVAANLLFKWGTVAPGRWAWGFFGGHLFGVTSIAFMMLLYRTMNPNVAQGICLGGSFLLAQVALALVYRSSLGPAQYAGILAMTVGMVLLALGHAGAR